MEPSEKFRLLDQLEKRDATISRLNDELRQLKLERQRADVLQQKLDLAESRLAESERQCSELLQKIRRLEECREKLGLLMDDGSTTEDSVGLRKELEKIRESLELYECVTAATKLRELKQSSCYNKQTEEFQEISSRVLTRRESRKTMIRNTTGTNQDK